MRSTPTSKPTWRHEAPRAALGAWLAALAAGGCWGSARTDHDPTPTPEAASEPQPEPGEDDGAESSIAQEPLRPVGCSVAVAPALLASADFPVSRGCFDNFDFGCVDNTEVSVGSLAASRDAASARLRHYCGDCHGSPATAKSLGTFGQIYTLDRMTEAGLWIPCSAEMSPLLRAIRGGSMPPSEYGGPRMDGDEIDLLSLALDDLCRVEDCICERDAGEACAVVRLENMLDERCGSCHGSASRTPASLGEGMTYIDNVRALVAGGQIVPCASEQSPLVVRVRQSMSHALAVPAELSPAEVDSLAEFVDGMCGQFAGSAPSDDRVENELMLRRYCGDCHGRRGLQRGTSALDSFNRVEDAEALLEAGWLVPCGSSQSPVLQRIRDGSMPPPDSGVGQPTLVEIDTLAAFIDRPCAGPRGYLVP